MGFIWSYFGGTVEDTEFCWGRGLVPKAGSAHHRTRAGSIVTGRRAWLTRPRAKMSPVTP